MAILYVFIKLHVILFNEVLNNKFPKTNPAVPSSLLAPESWCHCRWISTPLSRGRRLGLGLWESLIHVSNVDSYARMRQQLQIIARLRILKQVKNFLSSSRPRFSSDTLFAPKSPTYYCADPPFDWKFPQAHWTVRL